MNWAQLDNAYELAKSNNFPFRMHVMIWGNQQPAWIESLSTTEQLAEIEEWFAALAERYPNMDMIEVVNEPLHDPPAGEGNGNYIEALGGAGDSSHRGAYVAAQAGLRPGGITCPPEAILCRLSARKRC